MTLLLELQNPEEYPTAPAYDEFMRWAAACWPDEHNKREAGVVIRIVSEAESQAMNLQFRGKDAPTNVLSFPYDNQLMFMVDDQGTTEADEVEYLGDLLLCLPVVEREAQQQNKQPEQHWAHMVVHGLLHLQGFDHITDADAGIMEGREIEILHQLGFPDPYEDD